MRAETNGALDSAQSPSAPGHPEGPARAPPGGRFSATCPAARRVACSRWRGIWGLESWFRGSGGWALRPRGPRWQGSGETKSIQCAEFDPLAHSISAAQLRLLAGGARRPIDRVDGIGARASGGCESHRSECCGPRRGAPLWSAGWPRGRDPQNRGHRRRPCARWWRLRAPTDSGVGPARSVSPERDGEGRASTGFARPARHDVGHAQSSPFPRCRDVGRAAHRAGGPPGQVGRPTRESARRTPARRAGSRARLLETHRWWSERRHLGNVAGDPPSRSLRRSEIHHSLRPIAIGPRRGSASRQSESHERSDVCASWPISSIGTTQGIRID